MARETGRDHARGRLGAAASAGARHGAALVRSAPVVRTAQRHSSVAKHVVQRGRRADCQSRGGGLYDFSALRDRRAGGRTNSRLKARICKGGAGLIKKGVIKKRGRIRRGLIVFASAGGSITQLARGLWRSESGKRWLVPLAVFLCVFGLVLIVATTVEALAPFIYSIF